MRKFYGKTAIASYEAVMNVVMHAKKRNKKLYKEKFFSSEASVKPKPFDTLIKTEQKQFKKWNL